MRLLRSIVLAYVEHNTPIIDRIYHSWFGVFLCRLWQTWLHVVDETEILEGYVDQRINDMFITTPAHFSVELNAHSLLGICLLVAQKKLPASALSISNYHSQSCESMFRLTRSKFNDAYNLLSTVDVNIALEKRKKNTVAQVCSFVRSQFRKKYKNVSNDEVEIYSSDDEYDDEYKTDSSLTTDEENTSDDEDNTNCIPASGKSNFHGMRVYDDIPSSQSNSYLSVNIDGKEKFIHKETACWLLSNEKASLSTDRVKQVQQAN